ncbi:LutB/LldF family L-lactate oxidation iron-sulfur protein [Oceanibacterium hippocampi]|uniref:Lactate utilization protein B n=1 Tax=Oceanibacterium hippocampi TaxID=745714 RepID=A0A1Y5RMQ0_9PROT|nr:LutB/LldF family L-lactate oxidation iron-sulfur protein [Oceanibacterium hippocampi]SLN21038.1 Lactate utilization protein B [Oceanibacterium hippocampi]
MQTTSHAFKDNARKAMADVDLRTALKRVETGFTTARRKAADRLPEFEDLRDAGRDIKNHVLENLDFYLERFEERVIAQGGKVHWCSTPREARETILKLCRSVDARTATKGKSMIAEEIALNPFLEANGIEPIETDLGEYIIQLADEPPSHIIGPAVHKTKDQVSDLFLEHHWKYGRTERQTDPQALVNEAREILRQKYVDADVGITGANFLVAETGSTIIVTNEGNGDLTQMLPKMHIVIASLEKIVPTLDDMATIMRVLARSATGQEMSVYTTLSTGTRREGDLDGPEEFHVVLLDNGRSEMVGTELQELLRCIRCGACMNHCPVYHTVGGHAYGWVYPGPIGAALDPHFLGIEEARHLPSASTFCGKCEEVCPMRIPLPRIMRYWREQAFERRVGPPLERAGIRFWAFFARRPALYRLATRLAIRVLRRLAGRRGVLTALPFAGGWTDGRDLPAPEGRTFQELWKSGRRSP